MEKKTAIKNFFMISLLAGITLCLSACTSFTAATAPKVPAKAVNNACQIFQQNPNWYWEALQTYNRWGVPVSVQMAIIKHESDFQAGAKTEHKKFLGVPTWNRVTSAYGYAQVVNGTWKQYQQETNNYQCSRDKFGDASDFIGWYANKAHQQYGIRLNDAYNLYLAYHEGLAGYGKKTYLQKPGLMKLAKQVQAQAKAYRKQIRKCKYSIPTR